MRNLVKTQESNNGKYRIKVYYDESPESPCTNWDMGALFLFCYGNSEYLHGSCNWEELFSTSQHTMKEALISLVCEHITTKQLVDYIKNGNVDGYRMRYDNKDNLWYLEEKCRTGWYEMSNFEPSDLKSCDYTYELSEFMDEEDLISALQKYGKDIVVNEFTLRGYSQGDYVEGVAFITKERYKEYVSNDMKKWKIKANEVIDGEVEDVNRWMWGDVYGYVLEEKKKFTKTYDNGEMKNDYEWEEIDSCWGFYCEPDEIINEYLPNDELGKVG